MGDTLHQLGQLFLQTVPTVVLVFLLFIILDRILFRPLTGVMKQREELTVGALARAREQAATAETKTKEYEAAFQTARQEIYRQRETDRHTNLEQRDATLRKAREQAEVADSGGTGRACRGSGACQGGIRCRVPALGGRDFRKPGGA